MTKCRLARVRADVRRRFATRSSGSAVATRRARSSAPVRASAYADSRPLSSDPRRREEVDRVSPDIALFAARLRQPTVSHAVNRRALRIAFSYRTS
jgi:hypothetical protein